MIVGVVAKHPTRSKAIANQRPRIVFLPGGNTIVELGKVGVLVKQITRIQPGDISVGRIKIKEPREIIPVGIKDSLSRWNVSTHPRRPSGIIIARLAVSDVVGSSA